MKSAGQNPYAPVANPYGQAGYGQPYGGIGGYPGYPGMSYPGGIGGGAMFQPVTLGSSPRRGGGTTTRVDVNGDGPNGRIYAYGNIASDVLGNLNDALSTGLNFALASDAMSKQMTIATAYYATQERIAGMQKDVAGKQIQLQEKAIDTQYKMYKDQRIHEQTLARLEGATQERLARIAEDGKLARLGVMETSRAFGQRNSWKMGEPKFG